jgi:hypothetical protein
VSAPGRFYAQASRTSALPRFYASAVRGFTVLQSNRPARLACAGIRTRQPPETRPPPAPFGAYAEILIQSAANCQDGLKLAFYISATLMDTLMDTLMGTSKHA